MSPKVIFLSWFALVVGFLGGAWMGGAPLTPKEASVHGTAAVEPAPQGAEAARPAPTAVDRTPDCPEPADPRARELRVAIDLATERLRGIRAATRELAGDPIPFPDDLPDAYRPDAIRALAVASLSEPQFQILGVHCEEYPCLIEVAGPAFPGDTASGRLGAATHPFLQEFVEMDSERAHSVIAMLPKARHPDRIKARVAYRAKPLLSLDLARPAAEAP
jgi:hypothetical protein